MTKRTSGGIAYEERGSGAAFIALHGYSLDRRMAIGAFEPLFGPGGGAARDSGGPGGAGGGRPYRRLYPDLPFMGESTDEPGGKGHDGILDALRDFIDEVAPSGPLLLAGESYGGYLARALARGLADRVAGIFLLCPQILPIGLRDVDPPRVVEEEPRWREAARARGASEEDIADYEFHAVSRSLANFERTRSEIIAGIRLFRSEKMGKYLAGSEGFSFDRLGKAGSGGEAFDRPFEGPACFFLGRQDRSVGWRDALRLAGRYPRASYFIVDGAGHNAQAERQAEFEAAFRSWLAACGAVS
jgi:pimeloyl-ACP methyl ester carboxylesterase